jgi:AraC-like DNA-binding protein
MPEVHIQIFIIKGKMHAVIDNHPVTLQSDSLTDILHSNMYINDVSDDISVIFILTTETFISNFINNKPPFSIEYIMQILEQPVLLLNQNQSRTIKERMDLVIDLFKNNTHFHQTEMLKCALWMVYLEMSNIFMHQQEDINSSSETDHKRMLFMKFVKMLPLHIKQERSIGFYASALCISCQYLERVVKSISGETAYQWIQRTLIGEVNHQLKETVKSIQQIADDFGFPDQATFSKYYKRNTSITPTEFRNQNIV